MPLENNPLKATVVLYSWATDKPPQSGVPVCRIRYHLDQVRDPYGQLNFRDNPDTSTIQEWLLQDDRVRAVIDEVQAMCKMHLDKGKESWITFGFCDRRGKFISQPIALMVRDLLVGEGYSVYYDPK